MNLKDQIKADNATFIKPDDFGYIAIFCPIDDYPLTCNILINEDSELRPDSIDSGLIEVGTTIRARFSDVGEPDHGSTFQVNDTIYRVARTESNDGEWVVVVANEVTS